MAIQTYRYLLQYHSVTLISICQYHNETANQHLLVIHRLLQGYIKYVLSVLTNRTDVKQ